MQNLNEIRNREKDLLCISIRKYSNRKIGKTRINLIILQVVMDKKLKEIISVVFKNYCIERTRDINSAVLQGSYWEIIQNLDIPRS